MILSFALWAGLFAIALAFFLWGAAALRGARRRGRRRPTELGLLGLAMIAIAIVWPATEQRTLTRVTDLDRVMPVWQFNERHATHVNATPERIFTAIHQVTAREILFFRMLTAIRRLGRPLPPGIMNAPKDESLLDLATRTSFRYLANDPPRELVVATIIVLPRQVVATMNFLVTPDKNGATLSTETRVLATNDSAKRAFKIYWRLIRPGSDIIRRMWLRAIKRRAESA
jgi:hypothetical protein